MFNFSSIFTGKQDAVDATLEALNVISEPLKSMARMMVDVCAYAGTCTCKLFSYTFSAFYISYVNYEILRTITQVF